MAKNDFALAFNEMLEEKQLAKDVIVSAIESAMVSAYRRAVSASAAQHVEAKLNPESGAVAVFAEKEVVEDSVVDERTETLLEDARKTDPNCQPGDMVMMESTPENFGRVAAQTARQVIQQRIRDAERANQIEYYKRQEGEIVSGLVQATSPQGVTIGLEMKAEGIMPNNQRIPKERLKQHDRIRSVVLEVKEGPRGPQIILSRAHRNFLRRLLENEVPEIYHGVVEIQSIAREPGERAKVAVSAMQPNIDPVGACVGQKGVRIQAIVRELHDEKIDIIQWDANPVIYIQKAISPARVNGVYLNEDEHTATVVVHEDQLSLAIGREGQNARLAAKLTGWRIDVKSVIEAASDALAKLKEDEELQNALDWAVETIPQVEETIAKKAEDRVISPEEFSVLEQFIDRVERRAIAVKEETLQAESENEAAIRAEIPEAAFSFSLSDVPNLKEHIFNILTEAGYETAGQVMFDLKANPNKVLGLAGIGGKALTNIEESLAALTFPEVAVEAPTEEIIAKDEAEAPAVVAEESIAAVETVVEKTAEKRKEPKRAVVEEEEDGEVSKDGVSLDLFEMKPEMFQVGAEAESDSDDKKKGKKGKKKGVALEFDESLGEVVSRKKHKRSDDHDDDWE